MHVEIQCNIVNVWHTNRLNLVLKLYLQCAELSVDSGYM